MRLATPRPYLLEPLSVKYVNTNMHYIANDSFLQRLMKKLKSHLPNLKALSTSNLHRPPAVIKQTFIRGIGPDSKPGACFVFKSALFMIFTLPNLLRRAGHGAQSPEIEEVHCLLQ